MKRRNFIKTTVATSAFLTSNSVFGIYNMSQLDLSNEAPIDPIIPIRIFPDHEQENISQIIKLREQYGFRRFMYLGPSKTVRFSGFPNRDVYLKIGEKILELNNILSPYDIEMGWECSATIKQGPGAPYQFVTGIDGRISDISFCPLDTDFMEVLSNNISTVVSIAKPFMVIMEDDYTARHAGYGCFCPLHLAEFSDRQNKNYSREDLLKLFSTVTPESIRLRRAWAELMCDSLTNLAGLIRQKVDTIAPDTRILLCQPGSADIEGDMTESVTKAFAGNTKPAVRLYGTDYGSDSAERLPEIIFHVLYNAQRLPENFELYHESDQFPHTRFFMSASKIKSLMTAAFAYGLDDSRFHPVQNTDNYLEEKGYVNMYSNEINRFNALKAAVKNCRVEGCEIMYDPFEHIIDAYGAKGTRRYAWANVTGRLGIPHTSKNGKVKMVSGNVVDLMSDDEISKLLSGSVFLDGKAAYKLCKKGYKDLIGADVLPGVEPKFLYEGVRDDAGISDIEGSIMYNLLIFVVATEGGSYVMLKPAKSAKILTDFLDADENPVTPGMMRFENKLGGRVAITAFDLNNNSSSAVINYK
ncbi:hypothetical protein, partial [Mariniphaga sediminis]|uniref:hypothetical protein n=1 Tax=Mariniphaga sediminis TaxID=1628158 RepID=UPI0035639751